MSNLCKHEPKKTQESLIFLNMKEGKYHMQIFRRLLGKVVNAINGDKESI